MKRITMRDIAERAKVSVATVSLALRNDRRLPEITCQRIQDVAARIGYRPDPILSALSAYRGNRQTSRDGSVIAWLTAWPSKEGWRDRKTFAAYHAGAAYQAERMGYQLEHFWMPEHGGSSTARVLRSRGIRSVIVAPLPDGIFELDFDFRSFAAVQIGRSLHRPLLHSVTHSHYSSMQQVVHTLIRREYRRIGFAILESHDLIQHYRWSAALFALRERFPCHFARRPLYHPTQWDRAAFLAWIRDQNCDVVISDDPILHQWLLETTAERGKEIGFVCMAVEEKGPIAGVLLDAEGMGSLAVLQTHALLAAGKQGPPESYQSVVLNGIWHEGESLRQGRT